MCVSVVTATMTCTAYYPIFLPIIGNIVIGVVTVVNVYHCEVANHPWCTHLWYSL